MEKKRTVDKNSYELFHFYLSPHTCSNFPLSKPLIRALRLESLFYLLNYPLVFAALSLALSALKLLTMDKIKLSQLF